MKFVDKSLKDYSHDLAAREPVPGGGSASAYVGALALSLLSMVVRYSQKKSLSATGVKTLKTALKNLENYRKRFLRLVDLDVEGYMKVVEARKGTELQKKKAAEKAQKAPREMCQLCYQTMVLLPGIVKYCNPYLIKDLEAALQMIVSTYNSALGFIEES
jgi:formiminotetrahydrofolate cyclodeaminase